MPISRQVDDGKSAKPEDDAGTSSALEHAGVVRTAMDLRIHHDSHLRCDLGVDGADGTGDSAHGTEDSCLCGA